MAGVVARPRTARGLRGALRGGLFALTLTGTLLAGCGHVERAWPDGAPRFEGALNLDGERDGDWTFHYPDGAPREAGRYVDGRRVGVWRQWHMEGQLAAEGERRYDETTRGSEREGPWTFWHPDGTVASRGAFRAGRREGPWEFFDEDGQPVPDRTGVYVDGVLADD